MATFEDLQNLRDSKPEAFDKAARAAMKILSGLHNRDHVFETCRFPQQLPLSRAELLSYVRRDTENRESLGERLCDNFLFHLSHLLDPLLKRASWPRKLVLNEIDDLDTRIRYEIMMRHAGDFDREMSFREQSFVFEGELTADDYFQATCIRPEEFASVIKRYGAAVIVNSLDPEDPLREKLEVSIAKVRECFQLAPPEKTGRASVFQSHFPEEFREARELLKHFSRARSLFRTEPCWSYVQKKALQMYLNGERQEATQYLSDCGLSRAKLEDHLTGFERARQAFRGFKSSTSRSQFEKQVSKFLTSQKALFREQVPYKEFSDTERRLISDFLLLDEKGVPQAVIEITALEDDFIHDTEYAARMSVKEQLARKAGLGFYDLCEFDQWRIVLERELYEAQEPLEAVLKERHTEISSEMPSMRERPSRRSVWAFISQTPHAAYAVMRQ